MPGRLDMTEIPTVELLCDSTDLEATLKEFLAHLAQSPPWLRWLVVEAFQGLEYSVDLVPAGPEFLPAPAANQVRILAQPTEKLALLFAAMRAGNGQACSSVFGEFEHE